MSKGLFAGFGLGAGFLRVVERVNERFYGAQVRASRELLCPREFFVPFANFRSFRERPPPPSQIVARASGADTLGTYRFRRLLVYARLACDKSSEIDRNIVLKVSLMLGPPPPLVNPHLTFTLPKNRGPSQPLGRRDNWREASAVKILW